MRAVSELQGGGATGGGGAHLASARRAETRSAFLMRARHWSGSRLMPFLPGFSSSSASDRE